MCAEPEITQTEEEKAKRLAKEDRARKRAEKQAAELKAGKEKARAVQMMNSFFGRNTTSGGNSATAASPLASGSGAKPMPESSPTRRDRSGSSKFLPCFALVLLLRL